MSANVFDAIVVGAGVVGTASALALAVDGRRVALIEARASRPWSATAPDLRVYALAPDNAALLATLGVWDAITAARAQPFRRMRVWDAGGGGELAFDADALARPELGWIVENDLLVDRLLAALSLHATVELCCPDEVAELVQDAGNVRVRLGSGRRLRAPLLVAADGAASPMRASLGIALDAQDYGQSGLVAFVRSERVHEDTAWQRFLPGGPLAFLPFCADAMPGAGDGHVCSIVWTLPRAQARRLCTVPEEAFRRELERAFAGRLGAIEAVSARVAFPLRRQLARRYVEGRVALIGDAAHSVHPLAGQGVNLGLRDVACLRDLLRRAGDADPGAAHRLARYQRRRRSDDTLAALGFEAINRVFSNDLLLPTLLRGHLLEFAGRVPPLRNWLAGYALGTGSR